LNKLVFSVKLKLMAYKINLVTLKVRTKTNLVKSYVKIKLN